jgi:hypothetical protein
LTPEEKNLDIVAAFACVSLIIITFDIIIIINSVNDIKITTKPQQPTTAATTSPTTTNNERDHTKFKSIVHKHFEFKKEDFLFLNKTFFSQSLLMQGTLNRGSVGL